MKHISKKRVTIITLLFSVSIFLLISHPADNRQNVPTTILNRLNPNPGNFIDSSASYKEYKQILDSLEQISAYDKIRIKGVGEGIGTFLLGLKKIYECDTCKKFASGNPSYESGVQKKYFLELRDYTLNEDACFFIKNGKYYIDYTAWENVTPNLKSGHTKTKEVSVRYKTELDVHKKIQSALLIPISQKTHNFLKIIIWVILTPLSIFIIWLIFILPLKVLFRIALGDPFNPKNISDLRNAGITLITIMLLPILSSWLLQLFLGGRLPDEIYFPVWLYIHDVKGWIVGGLALLILSNAFKSGHKLQQEQDLTV